jgi:hypothetical protein
VSLHAWPSLAAARQIPFNEIMSVLQKPLARQNTPSPAKQPSPASA